MICKEAIFTMPISMQVGRKKQSISLNSYRNWHYQVSNNIKKKYKELVRAQIEPFLKFDLIRLDLTLYPPDKRARDRSNFLSVHEKFFCDALVECGVLQDDNDKFIISSHYFSGGVDRENPRVEMIVSEVFPSLDQPH